MTWELSTADWNWVLGVDLWSVIWGVQQFLPRMLAQAEGGHGEYILGGRRCPRRACPAHNVAKHGVVTLPKPHGELLAAQAKGRRFAAIAGVGADGDPRVGAQRQGRATAPPNRRRGFPAAYEQRMAQAVKSAPDRRRHGWRGVRRRRGEPLLRDPHRRINQAIQLHGGYPQPAPADTTSTMAKPSWKPRKPVARPLPPPRPALHSRPGFGGAKACLRNPAAPRGRRLICSLRSKKLLAANDHIARSPG